MSSTRKLELRYVCCFFIPRITSNQSTTTTLIMQQVNHQVTATDLSLDEASKALPALQRILMCVSSGHDVSIFFGAIASVCLWVVMLACATVRSIARWSMRLV
jgi:hypothetical protein